MALISRRALLSSVALAGTSVLARVARQRGPWAQGTAPAVVTPDSARPSIPYGVASGDVSSDAAIIWSRSNKPSCMLVEYATTDSCTNARRVQGPAARAVSIPHDLKPNRPPSDGLQFFGMVEISGKDEVMTVSLHNVWGEKVYSIDLNPDV